MAPIPRAVSSGTGPAQASGSRSQHGDHDQKSYQRSQRNQYQRQHRVGVQFPDMLRQGSEGEEKIAHDAAPPAQLLFEQYRQCVRHRRPAERVIVDVGSVPSQQRLMRQEPVFALIHRNAEPVAGANRRLDLEQQRRAGSRIGIR